ncbi:hypothetical protein BGZ76_010809 [Entomortierella beljakovae]|nr:hypothetical protein BGZ76_010809 [Entomortierella beljakovae]
MSQSNRSSEVSTPSTSLSIFYLPPELVTSLVPQSQSENITFNVSQDSIQENQKSRVSLPATSLDSAVPACRVCGISQFESVEKQREHARLDWHRYNLKHQLLDKSAKPITEQSFEDMMQDLSSISGSDSEYSDDYNDSDKKKSSGTGNHTPRKRLNRTTVNSDNQEAQIQILMKKLEVTVLENKRARNQDPLLVHQQMALEQQLQEARSSPFIWFTSPLYGETVRLGLYKNSLPNRSECDNIVEYLQTLQFPVVSQVKKQKNNKARREAKRAATAAEEALKSGEQAEKVTQPSKDNVVSQPETQVPLTGVENLDFKDVDSNKLQEKDDEDDDEFEYEPDWLKYQKQAKDQKDSNQKKTNQARYWTLILIGGGHFAGIVMDLAGQVSSHGKDGRDMKIVAHKTFHRYTVRRQQGGSQSAHGIANSAGARIRMYNEEALKLEVRELLDGWSHWIKQSECVFVHSPGNNRRTLFYENSVISEAERQGRLRTIPFMTRRPTLSELKRSYQELVNVKISVLSKAELEKQEQEEQMALEKVHELSKIASARDKSTSNKELAPVVPEPSPELAKLVDLVKKGRAEAVSNHVLKYGIDPSGLLPLTTSTEYDIRRTPTILHLSSHCGQPSVVKILLEKHMADPTTTASTFMDDQLDLDAPEDSTLSVGTSSFTAYDIAKDKETRNAFRRAMALHPDAWDWIGQAHVPSALTPEMEAEQERKAKEKTKKLQESERERKKTREANRPAASAEQASGSKSSSLMARNLASVSAANTHLSPEMRMRLERERRANAAESRLLAQKQGETIRRAVQEGRNICVACGKNLDGLAPFDKFGRKFCTTDCVAKGPA